MQKSPITNDFILRVRTYKRRKRKYLMDYRMTINSQDYHIAALRDTQYVTERIDNLCDNKGFNIELNNVFLDKIHLKWGKYSASSAKCYTVSPEKSSVTAHFCLLGSCVTEGNNNLDIQRGQCLLFREDKDEYRYQMETDNKEGAFFEMSMDTKVYMDLFQGENEILDAVTEGKSLFAHLAQNYRFHTIISEMYDNKSNYSGKLKKFYLESKAMELFLLQMSYLKSKKEIKTIKLLARDIEAIQQVRYLLENDMKHISISQLALSVGINQTKLKSGFKDLFGKTIFEYLTSVRMKKARELIESTELPISQIAEIVGYKYAQHFTVAFQKSFGFLPSDLK